MTAPASYTTGNMKISQSIASFPHMAILIALVISGLTGCIPVSSSYGGGFRGDSPVDDPAASDAKFTVLLKVFTQHNHAAMARLYKNQLESELKWRGLFVVNSSSGSELYWGAFKNGADADKTLQAALKYKNANGLIPFLGASVTPLPGANDSLWKWNIRNNNGYYSLLVAVFENMDEANPPYMTRRSDAEAYCRELRKQGYEAWYHHGAHNSSVTIGSFPEHAIESHMVKVPTSRGRPIRQEKRTPVDPDMLALMEKFPTLAYNGHAVFMTQKDTAGNVIKRNDKPDKTYPVKVPHKGR